MTKSGYNDPSKTKSWKLFWASLIFFFICELHRQLPKYFYSSIKNNKVSKRILQIILLITPRRALLTIIDVDINRDYKRQINETDLSCRIVTKQAIIPTIGFICKTNISSISVLTNFVNRVFGLQQRSAIVTRVTIFEGYEQIKQKNESNYYIFM